MKKRIVLISCVKKKSTYRAMAKDMYISTLFRYNMKYAESLNPDRIYILSAKYGLLKLSEKIEPYEKTLNKMKVQERKQWASIVLKQIHSISTPDNTEYIFLAGDKYRKYLLPHLKHTLIPLYGLSFGKQLQKLKELTS